MSFRTKVILTTTFTLVVTVAVVAIAVSSAITRSFEDRDSRRTSALVTQFRREFTHRGDEVSQRVDAIAASDELQRMAAAISEPNADLAQFVNDALSVAHEQSLDFLEFVGPDGNIISSAQWSARYGYQEAWLASTADWKSQGAFLRKEELPEDAALALEAVRTIPAGPGLLYIVGGLRIDTQDFLNSLPTPDSMHVLLYRNLTPDVTRANVVGVLAPEAPWPLDLIGGVKQSSREITRILGSGPFEESFTATPLPGRDNPMLAILIVGNSRGELYWLRAFVRYTAIASALGGVLVGIILTWWAASRVTRPLRALTAAVQKVGAGDWSARAPVLSHDEIGVLSENFNSMASQLVEQKQRIVQTERVAAWRELARRLAHELKNPLFPLQITVENLQRVRERSPEQFDEVFRESTSTLLSELDNLKAIIGRFSDFAKMPAPHLETVDVNEIARDVMRLFAAQLTQQDRPHVKEHLDLAGVAKVQADPDQLRRALRNLVLNAMDAMPQGGDLTVRTRASARRTVIEVADTGEGLTKEECERLFTPYYTTKQHGTGLGLAIVQSVVADHHGAISVESEPGKGTTFRIELDAIS